MPVYKRGNAWWVSVSYRGQRVRESAGKDSTKEQALELEAKYRSDFHAGRVGRQLDRSLSEAVLKWLTVECQHLKSRRSFESHARSLLPFIRGKVFSQVGEVVEDIKQTMTSSGLKAPTINRRLSILRRVLNLSYTTWGWVDHPIGQRVSLLPENCHRHIYLTPMEVRKLMSVCDVEARKAIELAAYTGLRRGEILGLTDKNIRKGCIILDANTKTGKPRIIPVPPGFKIRIPVIGAEKLRLEFERARKSIGRPDIRFHDLRHTYASWLVQSGAALTTVRDLLGHTTLSMTSRYAHLAPQTLRKAVEKLPWHNSVTVKKRRKRKVA